MSNEIQVNQDNKLQTKQSHTLNEKVLRSIPKSLQKIIEVKNSASAFLKLSSKELSVSCYSLIININAITGWQMLDVDLFDVFAEQMQLKLIEKYSFLNAREIEYAFRNFSVNEYGKNFNLNTMDLVLEQYLQQRKQASEAEQQAQILIEDVIELTDKERIDEINEYLQRKDLCLQNLYLIPEYLFHNMVRYGFINQSEKEKITTYKQATEWHLFQLANNTLLGDKFEIRKLKEFRNCHDSNNYSDKDISEIHLLYKKMSVLKVINKKL